MHWSKEKQTMSEINPTDTPGAANWYDYKKMQELNTNGGKSKFICCMFVIQ
jgi:hypothetical protein